MKHGDFTALAKYYVDRPGYSVALLEYVMAYVQNGKTPDIVVADVGAGTGKLTENLEQIGCIGYAVEPNDAMRQEGEKLFAGRKSFVWKKGTAEETGLSDSSVDWVLMGSSFHWADAPRAVQEFQRILKPGGLFTAIWNPRDIARSELHKEIEAIVYDEIPNMKRVSSGGTVTTEQMEEKLCAGGYFKNLVFMECNHEEIMTKERYMNIWRSVNDIQVQAGEDGFRRILQRIEEKLKGHENVVVPYKSRAWTAQVCKKQ